MKQLFEIYEVLDDYGFRTSVMGTIYANDKDEARKNAAIYYNNTDIYKTGYYGARLATASINLEESEQIRERNLRNAKLNVERYEKKIEL